MLPMIYVQKLVNVIMLDENFSKPLAKDYTPQSNLNF